MARSSVGTILVAAALGVLLAVFSRRTRFGLALRAAAADLEGARMAGVDPATLSRVAWVLSSVLGAVAMTLVIHPVLSNTYETTVYVAFAFAAAAVGRLPQPPPGGDRRRRPRGRPGAHRGPPAREQFRASGASAT